MTPRAEELRTRILSLIAEYHAEAFPPEAFRPNQTPVPVAGRVFDAREIESLVDSSLSSGSPQAVSPPASKRNSPATWAFATQS